MRLIDQIWTEVTEKNLLDDLTHIELTGSGLDELLEDYREEFSENGATIDDLQDYFGMRITIQASNCWHNDKKYKLLKEA